LRIFIMAECSYSPYILLVGMVTSRGLLLFNKQKVNIVHHLWAYWLKRFVCLKWQRNVSIILLILLFLVQSADNCHKCV
jgi:hypothetical protein